MNAICETARRAKDRSVYVWATVAKANELSLHKMNARIYSKYSLGSLYKNVMFVVFWFVFDDMKMVCTLKGDACTNENRFEKLCEIPKLFIRKLSAK